MMRYLASELSRRQIAYLHINEPDWTGEGPQLSDDFRRDLRERFIGTLIYCGHYTAQRAQALIENGLGDAAAVHVLAVTADQVVPGRQVLAFGDQAVPAGRR